MAISVDTVYKTVLYILNKEQRGYITPDEFNKLGTQVQLEIFENYFEELNQQLRVGGNSSDYANRVKKLEEKINRFFTSESLTVTQGAGEYWSSGNLPNKDVSAATITAPGTNYSTSSVPQSTTGGSGSGCTVNITVAGGGPGPVASFTIEAGGSGYEIGDVLTITGGGGDATITITEIYSPLHRLGNIEYVEHRDAAIGISEIPIELEEANQADFSLARRSKLTRPNSMWPMFYIIGTSVRILPANVTSGVPPYKSYIINYIRKPAGPAWGYTVNGTTGAYMYSAGTSTDFEIDDTDQTDLILKILQYCGVIIRDPQIVQTAAQMAQQDDLMEKS